MLNSLLFDGKIQNWVFLKKLNKNPDAELLSFWRVFYAKIQNQISYKNPAIELPSIWRLFYRKKLKSKIEIRMLYSRYFDGFFSQKLRIILTFSNRNFTHLPCPSQMAAKMTEIPCLSLAFKSAPLEAKYSNTSNWP